MFTRLLKPPKGSILLLGPRGTGKSTWIKQHYKNAPVYNLLDTREALRLSKNPSAIFDELHPLSSGSWVVIDEVQKVPALLDEVHRLIEDYGLKFVLSGSSARKLKRGGGNLLAGRAALIHMFPLVSAEVDFKLDVEHVLRWGMLPLAVTGEDASSYMRTYAEVYLQEEIRGEALTRNIGHFGRFLEVAARQNGQVTSVAGISRDAEVARQTVRGFFDILVDTLIGSWLEAWKLKRATKQVAHPKFYFFDPGVARALSGRSPYPPSAEEMGALFETWMLNELRAYLAYSRLNYPLYFWSSHDGVEVDVLCETSREFVAIEFKSSARWDRKFNKGLVRMKEEWGQKKARYIGVYTGVREARFGHIQVLPVMKFLKSLWAGEII